jgi:hypothetical protein
MKYQNTSRVLTLVFHAIILAAFGSLGFYYGAFCAPYYFTSDPGAFGVGQSLAYNLYLELATIGLTLMTISVYGVIQGIKGILHPDDDAPVVKGFTAFIVEGYIAAIFFLANAAIYFDLISGSNLAFIIVMAVLFAVILLIAANIPMVRLFDGKDQKPLFAMMSLGGGTFFAFEALIIAITYFVMIAQPASLAFYFNIKMFLLIGFLCSTIAAALLITSGVLIIKKGVSSPKVVKISGYLTGSSIVVLGVAQILIGALTLVWSDHSCHLEYAKLGYGGPSYAIMCLVSGVALLGAGIAFLIINSRDDSEEAKKPSVQA